jgi:hypothetical protein
MCNHVSVLQQSHFSSSHSIPSSQWMIAQHEGEKKHQNRSVNYIGFTQKAINISKSRIIICNKFWFMFTLVCKTSSRGSSRRQKKFTSHVTLKTRRESEWKKFQTVPNRCMKRLTEWRAQKTVFVSWMIFCAFPKKNVKWSITMEMIYRKSFCTSVQKEGCSIAEALNSRERCLR